jgi:hypothetical protein
MHVNMYRLFVCVEFAGLCCYGVVLMGVWVVAIPSHYKCALGLYKVQLGSEKFLSLV